MSEPLHADLVQQEFSRQAATFEDPKYSFGDPRLMAWILVHVPLEPDAIVLDVAGGTGHVARAFAPAARQVTVLDMTAAMLEEGKRQAESAGIRNVLFERGDAAALPYLDNSFDLVVSRFAIHHFPKPRMQISEMARVCRVGGRVAVIDLVMAEPTFAETCNRLERLRDPSHTTALDSETLSMFIEEAGTRIVRETSHDQSLEFDRWIAQASTPGDVSHQIRQQLEAELDGGPQTGMRPLLKGGKLHFTQRWAILVGEKSEGRKGTGS